MSTKYLTRAEAAALLHDHGFPCSKALLAKFAYQGGGPQFFKFGLRVLYRPEDLIAWAHARARRCASTSDPAHALPQSQPDSVETDEDNVAYACFCALPECPLCWPVVDGPEDRGH